MAKRMKKHCEKCGKRYRLKYHLWSWFGARFTHNLCKPCAKELAPWTLYSRARMHRRDW